MHVLIVMHSFLPLGRAGSEIYTYNLVRGLKKIGYQVTVFHREFQKVRLNYSIRKTSYNNIDIFALNNTFDDYVSFKQTFVNNKIEDEFLRLLKDIKPDLVHFGHLTHLSMGLPAVSKSLNIPTLMTLHDFWLICARGQKIKPDLNICSSKDHIDCVECIAETGIIEKLPLKVLKKFYNKLPFKNFTVNTIFSILKKFSKVIPKSNIKALLEERVDKMHACINNLDILISPSFHLLNCFVDAGVDKSKIVIERYGFNKKEMDKKRIKPAGYPVRLGFVGSLIPSKGAHILIDVFKNIKDKRLNLNIYGEAPPGLGNELYPQKLKIMTALDSRIKIQNWTDNDLIGEIFNKIDLLIVPSLWTENSPLVIQESFMANVPVISSDSGGMTELLKNGGGTVFKQGDSLSLQNILLKIVDNPSLIDEYRASIPRVNQMDDHLRVIDNIYTNLINKN